jgi:hypothetical protein
MRKQNKLSSFPFNYAINSNIEILHIPSWKHHTSFTIFIIDPVIQQDKPAQIIMAATQDKYVFGRDKKESER